MTPEQQAQLEDFMHHLENAIFNKFLETTKVPFRGDPITLVLKFIGGGDLNKGVKIIEDRMKKEK